MVKKILIVGAAGMLGKGFMQEGKSGVELIGLDIPDIDITCLDSVRRAVLANKPDILINCAAYTAVDKCETEQETAAAVNALGPLNLAKVCNEENITLVHYSTDYVFDGNKGDAYVESDPTSPQSVYGATKLEGEKAIIAICPKHYIIRTAWLYGEYGNNFVKTMISLSKSSPELKVVHDQIGSPTYTRDLIEATYKLVDTGKFGVYHITNSGSCSWYEFAREIFKIIGARVTLAPCTTYEFPRPAKRPVCGVLSKDKLNSLGIYTRPWQDALREYLSSSV